jgi:predicted nucleic acid-binding protein
MLLVDSTVWVDYFNGTLTPETEYLDGAVAREPVLVGDIILAEVLQGFRDDADYGEALVALSRFPQVQMLNPALAVLSAQNHRLLRKRGITIRKTIDCFIATFAIAAGHDLLHADRDFDPFEAYLGLRVVHPGYAVREG